MTDLKPVTPGDPVTLVLPDHVVQVEVVSSTRSGFNVTLSSRGAKTYDSRWPLEEEGVSWLRGYHAADSNEIKACRAAQKLTMSKEEFPRPSPLPPPPAHPMSAQLLRDKQIEELLKQR